MEVLSTEVLESGQPLRIGVPVLSTYGPVTDADLPILGFAGRVAFARRSDVVGGEPLSVSLG
jgi:D-hexose-6-phosphate mutarotase